MAVSYPNTPGVLRYFDMYRTSLLLILQVVYDNSTHVMLYLFIIIKFQHALYCKIVKYHIHM